ncbi:Solute carrier family 12 member 8 [Portunus trituberculatus]|uniref:Solute carrier family 12 member 8 n=1 Tax=Portunus trituberculatus TaxID=210409 RepID=A0A5B7EWL2_PORTR|nr:Solute carrier family 12 member 8 [Portunus trituberculatus]
MSAVTIVIILNLAEAGVTGWSAVTWANNTRPGYTEDNSWFTVLGVFFPTVTGIMAGINMSGDLRHPARDIPVGTLSALSLSTVLYLMFAVVLGATVERKVLLTDYMITEKVSALAGRATPPLPGVRVGGRRKGVAENIARPAASCRYS